MRWACLLAGLMIATPPAFAGPSLDVSERPRDAVVIPLYEGQAPAGGTVTGHEQVSISPTPGAVGRLVRNVIQPSLAVFKPRNAARDAHTAVLVLPGGGFRWLAIDSEGYDVARALAARGMTAIVLKYRLNHTAEKEEIFQADARALISSIASRGPGPAKLTIDLDPASNPSVADGAAAVRYVRKHAAELGVDTNRIGMVGFSAGGFVTQGVILHHDADSRPDFAAQIYAGGATDTLWPEDTPPLFLAVAGDDGLSDNVIAMFGTLRAKRKPIELHVYQQGGHGFGMIQKGLTTDLWLEEFATWLGAMGLIAPRN